MSSLGKREWMPAYLPPCAYEIELLTERRESPRRSQSGQRPSVTEFPQRKRSDTSTLSIAPLEFADEKRRGLRVSNLSEGDQRPILDTGVDVCLCNRLECWPRGCFTEVAKRSYRGDSDIPIVV